MGVRFNHLSSRNLIVLVHWESKLIARSTADVTAFVERVVPFFDCVLPVIPQETCEMDGNMAMRLWEKIFHVSSEVYLFKSLYNGNHQFWCRLTETTRSKPRKEITRSKAVKRRSGVIQPLTSRHSGHLLSSPSLHSRVRSAVHGRPCI
jgi:hypothetical protein